MTGTARLRRARAATAATAVLAAASLACPPSVRAQAQRYVLDPQHSFIHFEVMHFATSTLRGRIGPVQGEVLLDRVRREGEVSLVIDVASVDTGVRVLDRRLCADDLLGCGAEPQAYFVARRFEFDGDRVSAVSGELTLRGVSRGLRLQALNFGCRTDGPGEVCGGDFEGSVRRSDFGANFGLPFVADRVRLVVQVEGRRR